MSLKNPTDQPQTARRESGRSGIVRARPKWAAAILVCGKCLKRVDDGKALRRDLKAEAKRRAGKVRIVTTSCLGLCPKRAVATASAATLARGEILVLRDGGSAAEAVERLLPSTEDGTSQNSAS